MYGAGNDPKHPIPVEWGVFPVALLERMYYNYIREVNAVGQKICPVDVIAMCSMDGQIRPLRLRIAEEDQQLMRVDIDDVVDVRQISYPGAEAQVFLCRARVGERDRMFELKYSIRSHKWSLIRLRY